jgi:hypothetical protein
MQRARGVDQTKPPPVAQSIDRNGNGLEAATQAAHTPQLAATRWNILRPRWSIEEQQVWGWGRLLPATLVHHRRLDPPLLLVCCLGGAGGRHLDDKIEGAPSID